MMQFGEKIQSLFDGERSEVAQHRHMFDDKLELGFISIRTRFGSRLMLVSRFIIFVSLSDDWIN
jgi:hypothetical protein